MKRTLCALITLAASTQVLAAQTPDWQKITPQLQAALECRQVLAIENPDIKAILPQKSPDEMPIWEITPPKGFTVFGLAVDHFTIALGDEDEPGQGFATYVKGKTLAEASKAASLKKINGVPARTTAVGEIMAQMTHGPKGPVQLGCTINPQAL